MQRKILLVLMALVFLLSVSGCTKTIDDAISPETTVEVTNAPAEESGDEPTQEPTEEPYSLEFTDSLGTVFTFEEPIDEVIVLNRQTAEAIKILGAQDVVVATGDTTVKNMPYLGYGDLPDVGETGEPDLELIISLNPDVVFAHTNRSMELEKQLDPLGIAVVRIDNYQPEKFTEEMLLLGKILDKQERAQEFLDYISGVEAITRDIVSTIPEEDKPSVLALSVGFLNSQGGYRIFPCHSIDGTAGVGEGYSSIIAGGTDATPEIQYDPVEAGTTILVDEELVLDANPDAITLHGTWLGGYSMTDDTQYQEVMENCFEISSLDQLTAGKEGNVYIFHTDMLGASKRHIGLLQLSKYLYPDLFEDIDPIEYATQYFETWLDTQFEGIWWYAAQSN